MPMWLSKKKKVLTAKTKGIGINPFSVVSAAEPNCKRRHFFPLFPSSSSSKSFAPSYKSTSRKSKSKSKLGEETYLPTYSRRERWWGRAGWRRRAERRRRRRWGGGWRPAAGGWWWTAGWRRSWRPTAPTWTTRSGAPSASSPPRTSSARSARNLAIISPVFFLLVTIPPLV